ncbi:alpha/beta fold hydrolase [Nonomuraea sp. NPDC050383]|uniref:alpha/beta fold hydrolase n=1 Tax=Nonomuraea sp. NPDC050383 TaxID=3364362 RepID=UPI0037AF8610
MTTFVLVPGAWHGPSAWDRVVPLLERAGARTVTPDLAATPETGLRDHVETVVAALDAVGEPVVLAGHSYAGLVVRQAADRRPERVGHVALIDGWAGPDGAGMFTLAPEVFVSRIRAAADGNGLVPAPAPGAFGIDDPDDAEWLRPRLRPHPLRTFTDTTTLTGAVDRIPGTALYCRPRTMPFDELAEKVGYRTVPVDGPHNVMLALPEAVARFLLDISEVQNREA